MARLVIITLEEQEAKALLALAEPRYLMPIELGFFKSAIAKIRKQYDRLKVRIPVKHV